jgi:hypothetical protein
MNILSFKHWSYGLGAAFIGGGSGAVTATVTASLLAPDQFNLSKQLTHFIELASITFFVNGYLASMNYLKQSPLPPEETK